MSAGTPGHGCGQAGRRLNAARLTVSLKDLQRTQEFRRGGLAADDIERERGVRAGPLDDVRDPQRIDVDAVAKSRSFHSQLWKARKSVLDRCRISSSSGKLLKSFS